MSPLLSDVLLRAQSDERLAQLAGEGQARAFGVLVERYRKPLLRYAGHIADAAAADDLVQQALLRAWTSLSAGGEVRAVRAWLYQIVRNVHLTELTRSHSEESLAEDLPARSTTVELAEAHMRLDETVAAMAQLPDQQRLALTEMELGGRSRHEVAGALGVSEGAVRQLLYRARTTLRQAVTILTPLQLAEWAARPRAGSQLAAHVSELGGAGATGGAVAGSGAVAAAGAGSGLMGGGLAIKGVAAGIAAAGALGGAIAVVLPHHTAPAPRHHLQLAPAAVNAAGLSVQPLPEAQVSQSAQASDAAAGPPRRSASPGAPRKSSSRPARRPMAAGALPVAGTREAAATPAPESRNLAVNHSSEDRSHAASDRTSAAPERSGSSADHHGGGGSGSDQSTETTSEVTTSAQSTQSGEAGSGSQDASGSSGTEVTSETTSSTSTDG